MNAPPQVEEVACTVHSEPPSYVPAVPLINVGMVRLALGWMWQGGKEGPKWRVDLVHSWTFVLMCAGGLMLMCIRWPWCRRGAPTAAVTTVSQSHHCGSIRIHGGHCVHGYCSLVAFMFAAAVTGGRAVGAVSEGK